MLINELPDDCLLAIFDQFNNLHHLMACYKGNYESCFLNENRFSVSHKNRPSSNENMSQSYLSDFCLKLYCDLQLEFLQNF